MTKEQICLLIYFIIQLYNNFKKLPTRSEMFKFLKIYLKRYLKETEELDKKKMGDYEVEDDGCIAATACQYSRMSIINYYTNKNKLVDETKIIDIYSGEKLAERYKHIIDWPRWFAIVHKLATQCNERKDRFDKADIFEAGISECSNGKIKWVDDIGRDHHDIELNLHIEFKYQIDSLYTKKNKPKKTVSFKIKNSLGKTTSNKIENPADYYMCAQQNAVGIISYADLSPYLIKTGDGLTCKIPHKKINYIITPSECNIQEGDFKTMNYKDRKRQMQLEFINSIPPSKGFY